MPLPVFPQNIVQTVDRTLDVAAAPVTSPFTKTQDVQDWGGDCWKYEVDVSIRQGAQARSISSFLTKLRGPVNPFLFDDPTFLQSGAFGSPLVNGSGQSGNTLITDGWGADGLKDGDFFSLGTEDSTRLYQLTADVVLASGAAALEFVPALRFAPNDNDAIEVVSPKVLLRMTSPVPTNVRPYERFRFSFTAREAT